MNNFRVAIPLLAVLVAALGGLGVAWRLGAFDMSPSAGMVTSTGEADIGGPFSMVDQNGRAVDQSILNGKWSAIFFGYTYCPDVCPLTLQALSAAGRELAEDAKDFQIVFVSVDPARDTPQQIKNWLEVQSLGSAIGLTGAPQQIDSMVKTYRAYARVPDNAAADQGYLVDHSSNAWLMGPDGKFAAVISSSQSPPEMAQTIKTAMTGR